MKTVRIEVNFDENIAKDAVKAAGRKGVWSALDVLARYSKEQVPLDSGALKASCAVDVSEDGLEGTISYDTPYAVRWHENDANFQRGRKKKYLEDPANTPSVQGEMVRVLKSALESQL